MKKILVLFSLVILLVGTGCQSKSNSTRPLIGITSVYKLYDNNNSAAAVVDFTYVRTVEENGGTPVILPTINSEVLVSQYVDSLDGLVLVGGADIPPSAYGQLPHETVVQMPNQRYKFENRLISLWLDTGKPILGVCLGMQFTNVVSGGTMIQDIPSQVGTKVIHRGNRAYHSVNIEPDSLLAQILDTDRPFVYSTHHQAVKKLGTSLKVIARSDDGVIEALERTDGNFGLFVQWHPEYMTDDPAHRDAIYGAFINACVKRK
ncbi:MAG: gamma-glutamyl-gamma-aminobutyrate hydrolase family protein [Planctomycetota bacterium]|jgi:putative glutamine amidotransferase